MRTADRRWNPYAWAMTKSEFTNVLRRAERGDLKPVDEVKEIQRFPQEFLYELRWLYDSVEHVDADGSRVFMPVHVRLYHAEPAVITDALIGLHLHEKVIDPLDAARTRALQNAEIEVAARSYWAGHHSSWGIL